MAELVERGEKRDRLGRKLTPASRRKALVAAWQQSGLTQAAFARREGVRYPTFASWVQPARQGDGPARARVSHGRVGAREAARSGPLFVAEAKRKLCLAPEALALLIGGVELKRGPLKPWYERDEK
jgi:transposase-like protein